MHLSGTLQSNLEAAVISARRRQGLSVYPDTLTFWHDLAAHAWRWIGNETGPDASIVAALVRELEVELAAREQTSLMKSD